MNTFSKKPLLPRERICLRLKQARVEKCVSLEEISAKIKISAQYLEAVENCEFEKIPFGNLYLKNFIKKYLAAINIEPAEYLSQFCAEEMAEPPKRATKKNSLLANRFHLSSLPNILRYAVICCFAFCLIAYLGLQVKNVLQPPSLVLSSPENGLIAKKNSINISGISDPEVKISINGQPIMSDEAGQFSQAVNLTPGINTITVLAQKKHGKTTKEIRHIIYKETQQFSLNGKLQNVD